MAIIRVGVFWMGIFQVGIFQVGVILGGNFLWWEFSGWKLSGGNHLGSNFPDGSFSSNSDALSCSYVNDTEPEFDENTLIGYVHFILLNLPISQSWLDQFCTPLFVTILMVGQKSIKYQKSYFFITPTAVKSRTMKGFFWRTKESQCLPPSDLKWSRLSIKDISDLKIRKNVLIKPRFGH